MDTLEATRIVFSRIQNLDPENTSKIMGLLLIQDHGEKEMIRLAFGPEALLHSVLNKARKDLGLPSNSPPTSPSLSSNPISRQHASSSSFSSRLSNLPPALTIPNPSSSAISTSWAAEQAVDDFQLQDQMSFLNDGPKNPDLFYHQQNLSSSPNRGDSVLPSYAAVTANWGETLHRRSCSVNDVCFGSGDPNSGFGWRPCLYYARGCCKNGTNCRFLHEGLADSPSASAPVAGSDGSSIVGSLSKLEMMDQHCYQLLRSKSAQQQRVAATSQLMAASANTSFPYSPKCMNYLLQQQQNDTRRALMMGEDLHKLSRSPRNEFSINGGGLGMSCPASRQIYLTFPADSTFREEDVSNYFSIYGPVQDVRIPYQQKRMFGFVTFVYPETVKLILAKGNPHFVCDARVLVKPYKEKGKVVQEKKQQLERGDFSPCSTPTGLDSRNPFDLQHEPRMFYNPQEISWRRKLEQQAELEQALELQSRRLMNLQLLDVKQHQRALSNGSPIHSPLQSPSVFDQSLDLSSIPQERNLTANHNSVVTNADQSLPPPALVKESTTNVDNGKGKESPRNETSDLFENLEHNLPDSPFASPTKAAAECISAFSNVGGEANLATPYLPGASILDVGTFKSFNCQVPRYSSSPGTIGMSIGNNGSKCPVGI